METFAGNLFPITYWYGPPASFTTGPVYRQVREAGFSIAGPMGGGFHSYEENLKFLDTCRQEGLLACVQDQRMTCCLAGEKGWEQVLAEIVRDYQGHPALHSYYVTDEPNAQLFPQLAAIVKMLRQLDPSHPAYINLFPNYASPEQLGSKTYYDHVKDYIETVKPQFVSYDHYHFIYRQNPQAAASVAESGDAREDAIRRAALLCEDRGGFFDNLEVVRSLCLEYGLPFMVIVLLIEHGIYRNLTEAEIRFEAFQCIAYGASYLSYFTYWTVIGEGDEFWHWKNAMIDKDGTELPHYGQVQRVNRDLLAAACFLKGKASRKVMHFGSEAEQVTAFAPDSLITGFSGGRVTIGEFEDGYIVLANKDILNGTDITISLAAERVYLLDRASGALCEITNAQKSYALHLEPGDMALLKA